MDSVVVFGLHPKKNRKKERKKTVLFIVCVFIFDFFAIFVCSFCQRFFSFSIVVALSPADAQRPGSLTKWWGYKPQLCPVSIQTAKINKSF
jgi:hypothetical protein